MELLEYWKIIQRRLWLIILLIVLAGSGAAYYTSRQVDRYSTSTTLFINPGQVSPLVPGQLAGSSLINTYTELMRTRSFIERVAAEIDNPTIAAGIIQGALSTQYVQNTQFFRIAATHTNPEIAQQIANTTAQVLIASEIRRQEAQQAQIEAQRNQQTNAERIRLEQLISAVEIELAYYDDEIQQREQQVLDLQDEPVSSERTREQQQLFEELAGLRYTRLDVLRQLTNALARRAELGRVVAAETASDTAVVVDEALLPTSPLPRDDLQRILLAMGVALVMGVGLSFLLEYIDYTVKTPEALGEIYGLPVQGVIATTPRKYLKKQGGALVSLANSRSLTAESFRALRTGVQVSGLRKPLQSLLVTSAGPGEGKTFVAANLAVSLAQSGSRVILVDTDLRKPRLHHVFELPQDTGFTNLVVNQGHNLADGLHKTATKNLRVMTCGVVPPNPAELLESQRARDLMRQLSEEADIVIYDSPPAATVTDAAIIAQRVDAVLHVVWAGHTRVNHVLRCKAILEHVDATILGTVLNQVQTEALGYYSYYAYGYYHEDESGRNGSWWGKLVPGRKHGKRRKAEGLASSNGNGNGAVPDLVAQDAEDSSEREHDKA